MATGWPPWSLAAGLGRWDSLEDSASSPGPKAQGSEPDTCPWPSGVTRETEFKEIGDAELDSVRRCLPLTSYRT